RARTLHALLRGEAGVGHRRCRRWRRGGFLLDGFLQLCGIDLLNGQKDQRGNGNGDGEHGDLPNTKTRGFVARTPPREWSRAAPTDLRGTAGGEARSWVRGAAALSSGAPARSRARAWPARPRRRTRVDAWGGW